MCDVITRSVEFRLRNFSLSISLLPGPTISWGFKFARNPGDSVGTNFSDKLGNLLNLYQRHKDEYCEKIR